MGKGFGLSGAECKSEQLIGGCAEDSNSSKARKLFSKKVVAFSVFLLMIICASAVFAAGRCVPCRANHYCKDGMPILCPADKPVTNGTGGKSEADCMSCTTRNGAGNPFFGGYHLGVGNECISCTEDNEETPIWNGSSCVSCATANADTPVWNGSSCEACPTDTTWNGTACAQQESECVYEIPHTASDGTTSTLCLVESVGDSEIDSVTPKSAAEETPEFLAQYGIENVGRYYPDYWAGAMKYCQDKGLRLPTLSELVSVANYAYNLSLDTTLSCDSVGFHGVVGCVNFCADVQNQEFYNWLGTGNPNDDSDDDFTSYSSIEYGDNYSIHMWWTRICEEFQYTEYSDRSDGRVLCLKSDRA